MSDRTPYHDVASLVAVAAHERSARALFVGIDDCRENGRPLTQLQQIDLVKSLLACSDGLTGEIAATLEFDQSLRHAGAVDRLTRGDEA